MEEPNKKQKKKQKHKRFRAHKNVFSPPAELPPLSPKHVDWKSVFPHSWKEGSVVDVADVGCGFGGLLEALSPVWPERMILGLEIREPAVEQVKEKLEELYKKSPSYANCGVINMNAMKHLPNYFEKGQLKAMFFLYADPHFKKSKEKSRIISVDLLDVYAFTLAKGGRLYTATDIEELHNWEVNALELHPYFERLSEEECKQDPAVPLMLSSTHDYEKSKREGRSQWYSVWKRL